MDAAAIKSALDKGLIDRLVADVKVSAKKGVGFYIRAAMSFLKGMEAKEAVDDKPALEARAPVNKIKISGLADAINTAVAVALRVEADCVGAITSVQTKTIALGQQKCAQVLIFME